MGFWSFGKKKEETLPATTSEVPVPATQQSSAVPAVKETPKTDVFASAGIPTVDQLLEQDKKLDQLSAELGITPKSSSPKKKAKKSKKKAAKKAVKKKTIKAKPKKKAAKKTAKKKRR